MLYRLLHLVAWPLFSLLFGLRSRGARHVPAEGGVVVAANHASYLDPLLLACALPHRRMIFMAKEELFRYPIFGGLIRRLGAVAVRRGGVSRSSLRRFADLVGQQGRSLLVFPEGTRTADGRLGPAQRGVGAICRAAGVAVVPAFIAGSYEAWPRWRRLPRWPARFEVRFGAPIQWADRELEATGDPSGSLARSMMNAIAELERAPAQEPPVRFWAGVRMVLRRRDAATVSPRAAR